jgi:hypothetical protein
MIWMILLDHSEEDEELINQPSGIIKSIATKKILALNGQL